MKIALVSPYDWAVPGGVNSHINNLAKHFVRAGHTVRIIAPSSRPAAVDCDYFLPLGRSAFGLPASGSVANVCLSYHLGARVKALLERESFDILHLHEPFMPLLPFQFIRFSQAPLMATFHATREGGSRLYAYSRFILKPWWPRIGTRIAVSRAALRMISRYFADRYQIIPNGIDYPFFSSDLPPLPQFLDGKSNILFLGRQEKRKGLPYLLEAYRQLKPQMPDTRLIIVGPDGGMRAASQRFVERNSLKDVHFAGFVPYEELPRYYKTADVFCAPNTGHESFGIVLLEAMAAATPIVASGIEGFADVLTDGQEGLLVSPRNSEALAVALRSLLEDKDARVEMGARARITAAHYSWDRVSQMVMQAYEMALCPGGPH